jgi:hypothetical protein
MRPATQRSALHPAWRVWRLVFEAMLNGFEGCPTLLSHFPSGASFCPLPTIAHSSSIFIPSCESAPPLGARESGSPDPVPSVPDIGLH